MMTVSKDSEGAQHRMRTYLRNPIYGALLAFLSLDILAGSRLIALLLSLRRRNHRGHPRLIAPLDMFLARLSSRRRLLHLSLLLRLLELEIIPLLLLAPEEDPDRGPQRLVDLAVVGRERRVLAHGARSRERGMALAAALAYLCGTGAAQRRVGGEAGTHRSRRWPARSRAGGRRSRPACCSWRSGA